jgi:pyruvate,water dikinase
VTQRLVTVFKTETRQNWQREYSTKGNPAVKIAIEHLIKTAHKLGIKIGICGQAPSDYPQIVEFLVESGIDSISLNPDVIGRMK